MSSPKLWFACLWLVSVAGVMKVAAGATNGCFTLRVVDDQTGRGVPLVELRTVNKAAWWTDSGGIAAFDEPGLMDADVFFHVASPGYEYPKDMFGNRGLKLKTTRGGSVTIKLKRLNIAERLYRVTGQGIYRDSVLVGQPAPLKQPLLNAKVTGQDTVIAMPYRGKIFWFWGDTDCASYPLGNFGAAGATSELPGRGGLDPATGVDLAYFVDQTGFARPMCQLPGPAAHWIEGPFTITDESGRERLVTRVANQSHLGDAEGWDLMIFNDDKAVFEPVKHWDIHDPHDSAHPFHARVDGVEYVYLFPNLRVKADPKSVEDLANYEALTCVAGDGKSRGNQTEMDRDASGKLHYRWKAGADRLHPGRLRELISAGKLKPAESWINLVDFETGERIQPGRGSVYWNDFRRRWVMLISRQDVAGDIWFAEADTPAGPWAYARRVVTHGDYNFYNPTQHPFFDRDGGRLIYFEGTYSDFFSAARTRTPRYDYNQLMYRLALDDARLALPVAIYRVETTNGAALYCRREQVEAGKSWEHIKDVAWCALPPNCSGDDVVPVYATEKKGLVLSTVSPSPGAKPLFVGLPLGASASKAGLAGEWQFSAKMPDGAEFKFPLALSIQGERLGARTADGRLTGTGMFHNGNLALTLNNDNDSYQLEGRLDGGTLSGDWQKENDPVKRSWRASRQDKDPPEHDSDALVVLREYRQSNGPGHCYSIQPLPPPGCEPEGRSLCRVWKFPGTVLVADWLAKPVTSSRRD